MLLIAEGKGVCCKGRSDHQSFPALFEVVVLKMSILVVGYLAPLVSQFFRWAAFIVSNGFFGGIRLSSSTSFIWPFKKLFISMPGPLSPPFNRFSRVERSSPPFGLAPEWQSKQFSTMIFMATSSGDCAKTTIDVDKKIIKNNGGFNIF